MESFKLVYIKDGFQYEKLLTKDQELKFSAVISEIIADIDKSKDKPKNNFDLHFPFMDSHSCFEWLDMKYLDYRDCDILTKDLRENNLACYFCGSDVDSLPSEFIFLTKFEYDNLGNLVLSVKDVIEICQDCSSCGHREKKSLSTRQHECKCCGLSINRDLNASLNILRIGLDSLGNH